MPSVVTVANDKKVTVLNQSRILSSYILNRESSSTTTILGGLILFRTAVSFFTNASVSATMPAKRRFAPAPLFQSQPVSLAPVQNCRSRSWFRQRCKSESNVESLASINLTPVVAYWHHFIRLHGTLWIVHNVSAEQVFADQFTLVFR